MRSSDLLRQNESILILVARAVDMLVVVATGYAAYVAYAGEWTLPSYYESALILAAVSPP